VAEEKGKEENNEERGFTITDRRRSAKEGAEAPPEPATAEAPPPPPPPPPPPEAEKPPSAEAPPADIPPADFQYLVLFLATQALLCLGEQPDPNTGERIQSLPGAKQAIDLLSVIQEKTKGNLTEAEDQLLESMLYDLRMRYVRIAAQDPNEP
jgi:hypothetical protein